MADRSTGEMGAYLAACSEDGDLKERGDRLQEVRQVWPPLKGCARAIAGHKNLPAALQTHAIHFRTPPANSNKRLQTDRSWMDIQTSLLADVVRNLQ